MIFKHGYSLAFSQLMSAGNVLRSYLYWDSTQFNLKDLKEINLAVNSLLAFYFKVCDARQDEQAGYVLIRVQGAVSDFHSNDARYHDSCIKLFMNPNNVRATQNPKEGIPNKDATVASLVKMIKLAKDKI